MITQVIIGVAGSLVAALLLALLPRIMRLLGRGNRDISGAWDYFTYEVGLVSAPLGRSGSVTVRQWGSWVRLSLTLDRRRDGSSYGVGNERRFSLRGRWRHDEMVVRFEDELARHQTGVMVIHWRGADLVGKSMYVESDRYQAATNVGSAEDWITVHGVRMKRPSRGQLGA